MRKKVGLLFICLNPPYWPYLTNAINDCKKNFLPNEQVDIFVWTDVTPEAVKTIKEERLSALQGVLKSVKGLEVSKALENIIGHLDLLLKEFSNSAPESLNNQFTELAKKHSFGLERNKEGKLVVQFAKQPTQEMADDLGAFLLTTISTIYDELLKALALATLFEIEASPWPMPTLMRYHLFLQQEETLKDYDQLFYLDADMRVPGPVGEEIFSDGLTMAEHPMYAVSRKFIPPYEPNEKSAAFIERFGIMKTEKDGTRWYKPLYAAGGFQGGNAAAFIDAMKEMRKNIDKDFAANYVAIWNDESHWNKYLSIYEGPLTVLDPSYVYPDSLIKEYYEPVWGRAYTPKIVTLTKPFTTTKLGGDVIQKTVGDLQKLK